MKPGDPLRLVRCPTCGLNLFRYDSDPDHLDRHPVTCCTRDGYLFAELEALVNSGWFLPWGP